MYIYKKYETLDFTNDFMFCKILENNEDLCKELVEVILGRKVSKITYKHPQKAIEITADGKGIRLDVYFEGDDNTAFDLEMQTTPNRNIPKRSRYYQGMIDLDLIGRGKDYIELDESFIIFICMKNPFETKSRHKYSFENICAEDTAIRLEDKTYKIFVTPDSNADDVSEELSAFLNYLATKIPTSELTKRIEWEVDKARRHDEWRMQYMTLDMRDKEKREEGRVEGRLEERLNAVVKLLTKGCDKDFIKSLDYSDEEIANAEKVLLTDRA